MAFIYAHIHCAPMLLWLAEAADVRTALVREADRALRRLVRDGLHDSNPRSGLTVRAIIPWVVVEAALIPGRTPPPAGKACRRYRDRRK